MKPLGVCFRILPRVKRIMCTCYTRDFCFCAAELSLRANTKSPGMRCRQMQWCFAKAFPQCQQEFVSSPEKLSRMGTHLVCHPFSLSPGWKYCCALRPTQPLIIVMGFNFKAVHPRTNTKNYNTCFHLNKGGKGRQPGSQNTKYFRNEFLSSLAVSCYSGLSCLPQF